MDNINSHLKPVGIISYSVKKPATAKAKKTESSKIEKDVIPVDTADTAETTRQERIKIFIDKAGMNVYEFVEMGTSAFIGNVVGSAVAFAVIGGILPVAISGGIGAGAGLLLHKYGWDKKIGKAIGTGMGYALTPFVLAGRAVKNGAGRLIDAVRPSKKENVAKAEKGESRTKGTIEKDDMKAIRSESEIMAEKGAAKAVEGEKEKDIKKGILSTAGKGVGTVAKTLRAIPKFIYPSIQNATPVEEAMIMGTLDTLPLRTVTSTNTITINPTLADDMSAAGLARELLFDKPIDLDKGHVAIKGFNDELLIHELGHTRDFSEVPIPLVGTSSKGPWGKGPYVFDPTLDAPGEPTYASTNHWEDFAQSHKFYHRNPDQLKATSMEKFEAMDKLHEPTLYDNVMDRSGIREFGKKVSKVIDKVPHLRTAFNAIGTIMGPIEMKIGADKLQDGIKEADLTKKYEGKMYLAQGIAFSSKVLAPVGLGIAISKFVVDRKLKKGKWTIKQADNFASKAAAGITGPLGMVCLAITEEMLKTPEGQDFDNFKYQEKKPEGFKGKLIQGIGIRQFNVQEVDTKRKLDTDEANLTKGDKIFMAKVGGGGIVGGVAGTIAGYTGGAIAGATIGGLIGGPFGALLGGLLGKVSGTMFMSYQGSKAGAKLGRLLDKESRGVKAKMAIREK